MNLKKASVSRVPGNVSSRSKDTNKSLFLIIGFWIVTRCSYNEITSKFLPSTSGWMNLTEVDASAFSYGLC